PSTLSSTLCATTTTLSMTVSAIARTTTTTPAITTKPVSTSTPKKLEELLSDYDRRAQAMGTDTATLHVELAREKKMPALDEKKSSGRCFTFQLPKNVVHFMERPTLLTQVAEQLHTRQGSVVTQGLQGMGGVGKTQLATRYAQLAAQGGKCGERHL